MGSAVVASGLGGRRLQKRGAETEAGRRGMVEGAVGVAPLADQGTVPA